MQMVPRTPSANFTSDVERLQVIFTTGQKSLLLEQEGRSTICKSSSLIVNVRGRGDGMLYSSPYWNTNTKLFTSIVREVTFLRMSTFVNAFKV